MVLDNVVGGGGGGRGDTGDFEVMPKYYKCRKCAALLRARWWTDGTWTHNPGWCAWCRSYKVGGGWFVAVPPPEPSTTTTTTNPIVKLKRKPPTALTRALTLLRASSELPPDAGWECVSKAREILEREVDGDA